MLLPVVFIVLHLFHSDLVFLLDVGVEHLLKVVDYETYLLIWQIRDAHNLKEGLEGPYNLKCVRPYIINGDPALAVPLQILTMTRGPLALLDILLGDNDKVVRDILAPFKMFQILLVVQVHLRQQNVDNIDAECQLLPILLVLD